MARTVERRDGDDYVVRWFRGERDGVLSLYESEWGRRPSPAWFDWKYVDDPYLDHVPITIAVRDGTVVGSQAYVPFPVRWRGREYLALQPADAVVHRDHRRNGLYTRMTRLAIDRYEAGEPAFFFNFPSPGALAAQRELGWSAVDTVATAYRLQDPTVLAESRPATGVAGVARLLARGCLGLCDAARPTAGGLTVERHGSLPASTLAAVYEDGVPEGIHARRTPEFYEWWLGDPSFEHTVYVARHDGRAVAALVTRTRRGERVRLLETLPLAADRRMALRTLLAAWITDDADADVLCVAESTVPGRLLLRCGFLSDDGPVLSRFRTGTNLAARPLVPDGDAAPIPRSSLSSSDSWQLTFTEQDRF